MDIMALTAWRLEGEVDWMGSLVTQRGQLGAIYFRLSCEFPRMTISILCPSHLGGNSSRASFFCYTRTRSRLPARGVRVCYMSTDAQAPSQTNYLYTLSRRQSPYSPSLYVSQGLFEPLPPLLNTGRYPSLSLWREQRMLHARRSRGHQCSERGNYRNLNTFCHQ